MVDFGKEVCYCQVKDSTLSMAPYSKNTLVKLTLRSKINLFGVLSGINGVV